MGDWEDRADELSNALEDAVNALYDIRDGIEALNKCKVVDLVDDLNDLYAAVDKAYATARKVL